MSHTAGDNDDNDTDTSRHRNWVRRSGNDGNDGNNNSKMKTRSSQETTNETCSPVGSAADMVSGGRQIHVCCATLSHVNLIV